ncbi:MAG: hypothetical protein QM612_09695 [Thermomonas sp.]|uniref:hypothetical protein n=1 Tax=Thermomonas sp. TaxID=1971895 RepID=UPI0039E66CBB
MIRKKLAMALVAMVVTCAPPSWASDDEEDPPTDLDGVVVVGIAPDLLDLYSVGAGSGSGEYEFFSDTAAPVEAGEETNCERLQSMTFMLGCSANGIQERDTLRSKKFVCRWKQHVSTARISGAQ